MTVGVAGFGKMGAAMAARLRDVGEEVMVWNRDPARPQAAGFALAETPGALAAACTITLSSLFDDDAVRAVYIGSEGLLSGAGGRLLVEMSTVRPETHEALAILATQRGSAFLECPVSGTVGPARQGRLLGLVGGSPEDVERARPVLETLCSRLEHVGPVGAGATAKLAVNLPLTAFWASFGEAMALMRPLGRDPDWLVDLFAETAGAAAVMRIKAAGMKSALAGRDEVETTFDIDAMRKDLRLAVEQAGAHRTPLPVAASVERSLADAIRAGWGRRDCAWMTAFWIAHGRVDGDQASKRGAIG